METLNDETSQNIPKAEANAKNPCHQRPPGASSPEKKRQNIASKRYRIALITLFCQKGFAASVMDNRSQQQMIEPLYEREADAVPGPFYVVKDRCIICDFPPELAPKCIKMKDAPCNADKYCHVYKQPQTREELDTVIEAMAGSCVQAIRYCGSDPALLNRIVSLGMADLCDATEEARQNKRMESNG